MKILDRITEFFFKPPVEGFSYVFVDNKRDDKNESLKSKNKVRKM